MIFEHEIIERLSYSTFLVGGLSVYNDKPAIFAYYVPKRQNLNLPHILFYTENYDVPTRGETKLLKIEYMNKDIEELEFRRYAIEIINCLDNLTIDNEQRGQLRLYLSGNPVYKPHPLLHDNFGELTFILRGDLKNWGVV